LTSRDINTILSIGHLQNSLIVGTSDSRLLTGMAAEVLLRISQNRVSHVLDFGEDVIPPRVLASIFNVNLHKTSPTAWPLSCGFFCWFQTERNHPAAFRLFPPGHRCLE
jgi:hypothetical protein